MSLVYYSVQKWHIERQESVNRDFLTTLHFAWLSRISQSKRNINYNKKSGSLCNAFHCLFIRWLVHFFTWKVSETSTKEEKKDNFWRFECKQILRRKTFVFKKLFILNASPIFQVSYGMLLDIQPYLTETSKKLLLHQWHINKTWLPDFLHVSVK